MIVMVNRAINSSLVFFIIIISLSYDFKIWVIGFCDLRCCLVSVIFNIVVIILYEIVNIKQYLVHDSIVT